MRPSSGLSDSTQHKAGIDIKAPGASYDPEKMGCMNLEVSVGV